MPVIFIVIIGSYFLGNIYVFVRGLQALGQISVLFRGLFGVSYWTGALLIVFIFAFRNAKQIPFAV